MPRDGVQADRSGRRPGNRGGAMDNLFLPAALSRDARLRLFCFPYAGGGSAGYYTWSDELPADVQVCPVELPGRERRLRERPYSSLASLVTDLADALHGALDRPFALFGHSMGALITFELARELRRRRVPGLCRLFVSGFRAPQLPCPQPALNQLPDAEFAEVVGRQYQGIPPEVASSRELMTLLLPTLRADFTILESYRHVPEEPFDTGVSVFGGDRDDQVPLADLEAWSVHTRGDFVLRLLPGGHFFLKGGTRTLLLQAICHDLRRC